MSKVTRAKPKETEENLIEKVIHVNRVAKVVKGGRRFSFSAVVAVGDGQGRIGLGFGKANEVPEAIRKATNRARASMIQVAMVGGTVAHDSEGHFGAGRVLLRPATAGTGVIAGPTVRAILDAAGFHNVLTKCLGTGNPYNVVRATMDALRRLETPEQFARRLGKSVDDVMAGYTVASH